MKKSVLNQILEISEKAMGIILIYLSIFLFLTINIDINNFFTLISCVFTLGIIYILHFPLLLSALESNFEKIIYPIMYIASILLIIYPILSGAPLIPLLLISIVLILLIFRKINDDYDMKEKLIKYVSVYVLWILSIIQVIFNVKTTNFKLINILAIIICLCKYFRVYENVKSKYNNDKQEKIKEKNKKYYMEHPEEKKKADERMRIEREKQEKLQEYLNSVPDYIMPKELYKFDENIATCDVYEKEYYDNLKRKNTYIKNFMDIVFNIKPNFYKMENNNRRSGGYYIDTLYGIKKDYIYEACENMEIVNKVVNLRFKTEKYSNISFPTVDDKDDEKFKDYYVRGYLTLYFNAIHISKKENSKYRKYGKRSYFNNYAMIISNKDKTNFYIAVLTTKKREKDEYYVEEIMKELNPDLKNYVDAFGNEILFKRNDDFDA